MSTSLQKSQAAESLALKLMRGQIVGSFRCALETAELLNIVLKTVKVSRTEQLIDYVKAIGCRLQEAKPIGSFRPFRLT